MIFAISIVILVSGCAIPYAKKGTQGFKGGYDDKKIGDEHYAIEIEGNGYTSYELAERFFHKRAAELCEGKPYKHSFRRTTTQYTHRYFTVQAAGATYHVFPVVVGEVQCEQ